MFHVTSFIQTVLYAEDKKLKALEKSIIPTEKLQGLIHKLTLYFDLIQHVILSID